MNNVEQECTICKLLKDRKEDFYWPPTSINPMKKCKKCYSKERNADKIKTKNIGFSGLEDDVKERVFELYVNRKSLKAMVEQLQKEYPDHNFTYGKVQQWHKKGQIVNK